MDLLYIMRVLIMLLDSLHRPERPVYYALRCGDSSARCKEHKMIDRKSLDMFRSTATSMVSETTQNINTTTVKIPDKNMTQIHLNAVFKTMLSYKALIKEALRLNATF